MSNEIVDKIAKSGHHNVVDNIDTFLKNDNLASAEVAECYDKWAETYESDLGKVEKGYNNPEQVAKALDQMCSASGQERQKLKILDVACGTGLVGLHLRNLGFDNIDGLDGSSGMLEKAKKIGIYKNCFQEIIRDMKLQSVSPNTYDALITTGSFCPNHLTPNCLRHLTEVVKSGGLIIIAMRKDFAIKHAVLKQLPTEVKNLESIGIWDVLQEKTVENYYGDESGLLYVMRKK